VLLIPFLMAPEPAMAGMWQTDDQQAAKELKRDPAAAAELFTDKAWRGTALYRAGKYDEAADAFNTLNSADAAFNRGNSLAMAGDLEGAIDAYEEALKKQPKFPAATKNLEQVKRHLEEQKEQEQQQQDSGDSSDEQNQDGEQGDQQDQQNSDSSSESNSDSNSDSNSENSQSDPSDQNSDSQESDSSESQQDPSDSEEGKKSDDEFAEQKAQEQAQEQTPAENSESSSAQDRDPNDKQPDAQADAQADEQDSNDSEAPAALEQEQPTNDAGDESDAEALDTFSNLSREERAAMDSLLNQVPDNPGLLMQRKFLYQYRQNTDQTEEDVLW
jgi:Ca-activated chloride channel family protein